VGRLAEAVEGAPGAILVGHSLGCALIADLAAQRPDLRIDGALLVAPADVDREDCVSAQIREFAPMPIGRLPFRSVVVASMNDPYMTIDRARILAETWGAGLVNAGSCGHINVASGFGPWPAGERILEELVSECRSSTRSSKDARARPYLESGRTGPALDLASRPARPPWLFRAAPSEQP
jgi:hypothetical protein